MLVDVRLILLDGVRLTVLVDVRVTLLILLGYL